MKLFRLAVIIVVMATAVFIGVRALDRPSKTNAMQAAARAGRHPSAIAVQWSWTHLDWQTREIYDL